MLQQRIPQSALLGDTAGTEGGGGDGKPLLQEGEQVRFHLETAEEGDDCQSPLDFQRIEIPGEIGASDHVQYQVDARVAGASEDCRDEILRLVIDSPFRTETLAGPRPIVAAGGREHPRPKRLPELDGGRADSRGAAVHQQRFAGLQAPALEHIGPDRVERLGQPGSVRDGNTFWYRQHLRIRCDAVLRVAAACHERSDRLARRETVNTGPGLHDLAGNFKPRQVARPGWRRIQSLPLHDIRAVDTSRLNLNQDFVMAGFGDRPPARDQHVRTAGRDDLNRIHLGGKDHQSCPKWLMKRAVCQTSIHCCPHSGGYRRLWVKCPNGDGRRHPGPEARGQFPAEPGTALG